jgi:RNA polymerase sigma factor (TIGR02999 family)
MECVDVECEAISVIELLSASLEMVTPPPNSEITTLLINWSEGDSSALEKLMPLVYAELRLLARRHLRKEQGLTLQTSDLVHEAYLKLVNQRRVRWQTRTHFYAIASRLMRRVLVDRARSRNRIKRGDGAVKISLSETALMADNNSFDLLAFDEVLTKLAELDPRKARIVELRFFGGLSIEETAAFLKISEITVKRDWRMAKAWLHKSLS